MLLAICLHTTAGATERARLQYLSLIPQGAILSIAHTVLFRFRSIHRKPWDFLKTVLTLGVKKKKAPEVEVRMRTYVERISTQGRWGN